MNNLELLTIKKSWCRIRDQFFTLEQAHYEEEPSSNHICQDFIAVESFFDSTEFPRYNKDTRQMELF